MSRSPARVALDRLAIGALTGALTGRPVAALAGFGRDAVAGLRPATPADVLDRTLALVEGAARAGGDGGGRPVAIARPLVPAGLDAPPPSPSPQQPSSPGALVSPGVLVDVASPTGGGAATVRPTARPAGKQPGVAGDGRPDAASTMPAVPVTPSRELTPIGRTPPTSQAGGRPVTPSPVLDARALDAARRAGPAVPSTLPRPRFERSGPESDASPASSSQPAIPQPPRPAAATPAMEVARRPKGLADLATLLAPASTADASPTVASSDDRPASAQQSDRSVTRAASVRLQGLAPFAATGPDQRAGWPDDSGASRTLPSPAADLAGAAAVLEAVLVHEARRYGVVVTES